MSFDEVGSEVSEGDAGQSADEVAASSAGDQANPAVEEGGSAAAAPSHIMVGNQKFASQDDLVKAYQELQKGFTQKTQSHARELAAYKGVSKWLSDLRKDPDTYERFLSMLKNGVPAAQAAQAAAQGAQTPQATRPQSDPYRDRFEAMERDMAMEKASREAERFMQKHPELSEDEFRQVVEKTIELQEDGRERSLEEVYRTEFFEMAAAKFHRAGEQKAREAQDKSRQGASLGSGPAASAAPKRGPRYGELKGDNAKDDFLREKLRSKGFKFDSE